MDNTVENDRTPAERILISTGGKTILIGHQDGHIMLADCDTDDRVHYRLQNMRLFSGGDDQHAILHLLTVSETKFISINDLCRARLWDLGSETNTGYFDAGKTIGRANSAVLLPNNMLAIAGSENARDDQSMRFWIWDVNRFPTSGKELNPTFQVLWRAPNIKLAVTAQGFLIACGQCDPRITIWRINRLECTKICEVGGGGILSKNYSVACLPTGEVVIGDKSIEFYKVSADSIEHQEVDSVSIAYDADFVYPVAGYKLLIVYRSEDANTFLLRNLITGITARFDYATPARECTRRIAVIEEDSLIVCLASEVTQKIDFHTFVDKSTLHFPKNLSEIRKNARILFQAQQMENNLFAKLPVEIILKIVLLTPDCMTRSERRVSGKIASNYFSFPSVRDQ